jgi:hypothetical protein
VWNYFFAIVRVARLTGTVSVLLAAVDLTLFGVATVRFGVRAGTGLSFV